jgi:hypothetical protein
MAWTLRPQNKGILGIAPSVGINRFISFPSFMIHKLFHHMRTNLSPSITVVGVYEGQASRKWHFWFGEVVRRVFTRILPRRGGRDTSLPGPSFCEKLACAHIKFRWWRMLALPSQSALWGHYPLYSHFCDTTSPRSEETGKSNFAVVDQTKVKCGARTASRLARAGAGLT